MNSNGSALKENPNDSATEANRCALEKARRANITDPSLPKRRNKFPAFVASLFAFMALNIALMQSPACKPNPEVAPYRGWSWWTRTDIRNAKLPSNVVLLGSSLMVAAIAECDANFYKSMLDLATYRGAAYLDCELQKKFTGRFNTLNLSAPGQMPSDAYLTLKTALDEGVRPQVLVYGVAPRDFLDGTMQSPSDTETFKCLGRSADIRKISLDFFLTPFGKFDYLLKQNIALYRMSMDYRIKTEQLTRQFLTHNGIYNLPELEQITPTLEKLLHELYRPFDIKPKSFLAFETKRNNAPRIDNTSDYKARYRNPDHGLYTTQFCFLGRIAKLCSDHKIKLVVVEMPITEENVNLLKPQVHQQYKNDLVRICRANSVPLLNLCQYDKYAPSDYRDTVHLNGYGGKKFVDNLVPALSSIKSKLML